MSTKTKGLFGGLLLVIIIAASVFYYQKTKNVATSSNESTSGDDEATQGEEMLGSAFSKHEIDEALKGSTQNQAGENNLGSKSSTQKTDENDDLEEYKFGSEDHEIIQELDKVIDSQLDEDYADFFASIKLSPEKAAKTKAILMENKKYQQNIMMMLMDESKSIEEIHDRQELLQKAQKQKIEDILGGENLDKFEKHNETLGVKSLKKQVGAMIDDLNIDPKSRSVIINAFVEEELKDYASNKSLNLLQSNHDLSFRPEQLKTLRSIMVGTQHGDAKPLRDNLNNEKAKLARVLKRIPNDPKMKKDVIESRTNEGLRAQEGMIDMVESQKEEP